MAPAPESIAAAARRAGPDLGEALATAADWIAADLAERLGMVAWEREQQIGQAQRRLAELEGARVDVRGDSPVRVRELLEQPLDALEVAWRALRSGQRVHVESEAEACPAVHRILRDLGELLGHGWLTVSPPGVLDHDQAERPRVGVVPRSPRIALVQADADPELTAYLLARACLRRTGFDPRVVHRVIIVGESEILERHLRRLWIGARMGPVDDEKAFAGPVDPARAERYLAAQAGWSARAGITTLCRGGRLLRADHPELQFLAPALFRAEGDDGSPPSVVGGAPERIGPMLLLLPVIGARARERAEAKLEQLRGSDSAEAMRFGVPRRGVAVRPNDRQIDGALLVERLPPGLPEPRP